MWNLLRTELDSVRRKVSEVIEVISGPGEAQFSGLGLLGLCTSL